ncbi:hypothetical protein BB561_004276 [Smittium simulii]|uniref:Cyclin N-terminal domain-containing protein n=1 Tax=Smittium simulii TaxID=133385 RepID=A0A2T9YH50_9FUNG|nr:hypothetical protein BB561_004276 [Smittium simulii]
MEPTRLYAKQQMLNTPSALDGISLNDELQMRRKACTIINQVSTKLHLPQIVQATACALVQRFYMVNSLRVWHHYNVAAIALYCSCKIEENLRKLEDFIPAFSYYASKQTLTAQTDSEEYRAWQKIILSGEIHLLASTHFELFLQHPHELLLSLVEPLQLDYRLAFFALGFISDCYKTPIIVLYQNVEICIASVILSLRISSTRHSSKPPNTALNSGSIAKHDNIYFLVDQYMKTNNITQKAITEVINWITIFYAQSKPLLQQT